MSFWFPLDSKGSFTARKITQESLPPRVRERLNGVEIPPRYLKSLTSVYGSIEKIPTPIPLQSSSPSLLFTTTTTTTNITVEEEEEEKEDRMIEVNTLELVFLTGRRDEGRWYTYLMSLPRSVPNKTDSYIGYTTNPLIDIYLHNEKLLSVPDRNTGSAAPHWMLDMVLGPFICKELAIECGRIWVDKTRGKVSKRNKASLLAQLYDVPLYTFEEKLSDDVTMQDLLEEYNVPPVFRDLWSSMSGSCDIENTL